ncbi:hypothetical protein MHBO_000937 [Bonamia ostreae]|uniref:Uncharacterized protein n=1 Tax=Bonamia ostreae TaxID=126728 RepID=A0ABV2AHB9_9EUKA
MVLCASSEDKSIIEFIKPPKESKIGERVYLENNSALNRSPDETVNAKKKNSAWALAFPDLKTDSENIACYKNKPFLTSKGKCCSTTLKNCQIS